MTTNRKTILIISWILGFLSIWLTVASAPAAAAEKASAPALQTKLKPLSFFVGQWSCTGHFPNGKSISSHKAFTMALDGHWLKMKHHDNLPHHYRAIGLWGYDSAAKQFTVYLYDNFGGVRHYTSSGWKGNKLVLNSTATQGYVDRFTFQRLSDSSYQVAYAHKDHTGKWTPSDTLTCTHN